MELVSPDRLPNQYANTDRIVRVKPARRGAQSRNTFLGAWCTSADHRSDDPAPTWRLRPNRLGCHKGGHCRLALELERVMRSKPIRAAGQPKSSPAGLAWPRGVRMPLPQFRRSLLGLGLGTQSIWRRPSGELCAERTNCVVRRIAPARSRPTQGNGEAGCIETAAGREGVGGGWRARGLTPPLRRQPNRDVPPCCCSALRHTSQRYEDPPCRAAHSDRSRTSHLPYPVYLRYLFIWARQMLAPHTSNLPAPPETPSFAAGRATSCGHVTS